AKALQIAPSELMRLPVPAPANGHTDSATEAVRLALTAVCNDLPGGQVLPAEVLRARVTATVDALCRCDREDEVGGALPVLIRDLHSSIAAGRDMAELLPLAAWLHTQATVPWLRLAGAPLDLCSLTVMLARQAAQEHGTPAPMGLVAATTARVMITDGALDLARAGLDAVNMPTNTPEHLQLTGHLALRGSMVAAHDKSPAEVDTALTYAAELAQRTGEGNAFGLGFGPVNVGLYQMAGLVTVGDHERAVSIAEGLNPQAPTNRSQQAAYWGDYGRALARVRGRRDDAVMALRRAESISPHRVLRDPITREVIAVLLAHSRRRDDALGRELRGMAYRAGLPV
ncbi:MAG: XRE family transcriptional regulator, partial [Actinomycetes bacterium]